MSKVTYPEEEKLEIVNLYLAGLGITKIHKKTGRSAITISKLLKEKGIEKRAIGSWTKKYSCDEDKFEKIDTPEKAYWLGFLYADGCITKVNTVNVLLSKSERVHIEKFKRFLNATNPIEEREDMVSINGKSWMQGSCKIRVGSKKLCNDLIKLGCLRKKTYILKWPNSEQVPEGYINHFLRGWFDGDGSIWITKKDDKTGLSITGTDEMNYPCQEYLKSKGIKSVISRHPSGKNISILGIFNYSGIFGFEKLVYKNANTYLQRKNDKFKEIREGERYTKYIEERKRTKGIDMQILSFFNLHSKVSCPMIFQKTDLSRNVLDSRVRKLINSDIIDIDLPKTGKTNEIFYKLK